MRGDCRLGSVVDDSWQLGGQGGRAGRGNGAGNPASRRSGAVRVARYWIVLFTSGIILLAAFVCSKNHGNVANDLLDIINKNRTSQNLPKLSDSPGLGCIALQYAEQCKVENCSKNNTIHCQPHEDDFTQVFAPNCGVELPTFGTISGHILGCQQKYLEPQEAFSNLLVKDQKAFSMLGNKTFTEVGVGVIGGHKHKGPYIWCVLLSNSETNTTFVLEDLGVCRKSPRPRYPRVWRTNKKIGTISKSLKFVECIKGLSNGKEEVYGALDSYIAWELEFPLITVKKTLKTLESEKEWNRTIQMTKWMLSKGQGRTMGSYYSSLLNVLAEDGRLDEAEELWRTLFSENLESMPRMFFERMISIYYQREMHDKLFEVFADMEELGIRPMMEIVTMVGNVFQKLDMLDKYQKLKKKYPPPKWEYRYFKGKRIKIRTKYADNENDSKSEQEANSISYEPNDNAEVSFNECVENDLFVVETADSSKTD
ncbi:hypothetical protein RD792_015616 [Penstemon davidsonii]|uniref:Uncharacterized GPI-anchored protein At5g19230-like domain-containing protein n=1 Tax=Penstemon davidsonii TaxID=160366 RepID=A0ABR0CI61_9LAMI|nr:hypothetical protein RD792_015616 [Penstemon davidsonii]